MKEVAALAALVLFVLSCADAQTRVIVPERESMSPETIVLPVDVPPFGVEHQVRLSLEARIDWPSLSGSNPWISVIVNGNRLGLEDLLNKTNAFSLRNGVDLAWYGEGRWRLLYSPDFELALTATHSPYSVAEKDHPYRFVWDITRHVKPGEGNEIKIEHHKVLHDPDKLVLRNVAVEVGKFIEPPRAAAVEPAPTGPLATIVAAPVRTPTLQATARDATIDVRSGGQRLTVRTRMSLPGGTWREARAAGGSTWTAGPCQVSRRVTVRGNHVAVADTLTNTTDQIIGVKVEHHADMIEKPEALYLGGQKSFTDTYAIHEPAHPSSFAQFKALGVGLVAEDDVFRVHSRGFHNPQSFGLADDRLGLAPHSSVTLEWSIYPVPGDYWAFVNTVRRNWNVNFTIPGAFIFAHKWQTGLTAEQYAKWMHDRGLKYICGGIAKYANGPYAHGTGILFAPEFVAAERDWTRKMAAADPNLVPIAYFHAQCNTEPDSRTKYADSRLLDAQGRQIDYPHGQVLPLFVPTLDNSYGKAIWKFVDCLIDDVGVKGIYWDEMSYSVAQLAHGLPWDGHTVAIDPQTHAVTGQLASVPLIMQSLAEKIVDYIQGKGLFFMANTQAHTRTMMRKQLVRFVETGTYSACWGTHLGCPLALGNHCSEDTHSESATHVRELLKRGNLYYGHYYSRDAAPWNFTSVMFPITPEQIGPGYVLGKERIHTAVSGRFGFPDGAAAEVYVVDGNGARVTSGMVTEVKDGGKRRYDLRMPGDHFAILVRQ